MSRAHHGSLQEDPNRRLGYPITHLMYLPATGPNKDGATAPSDRMSLGTVPPIPTIQSITAKTSPMIDWNQCIENNPNNEFKA